MTFLNEMDPTTGLIERKHAKEKGRDMQQTYQAAQPFPHIVIDDFLPEVLARSVITEFDRSRHEQQAVFNREHERLKREFNPDELSPVTRNLFYAFNSRPFIQIIE